MAEPTGPDWPPTLNANSTDTLTPVAFICRCDGRRRPGSNSKPERMFYWPKQVPTAINGSAERDRENRLRSPQRARSCAVGLVGNANLISHASETAHSLRSDTSSEALDTAFDTAAQRNNAALHPHLNSALLETPSL